MLRPMLGVGGTAGPPAKIYLPDTPPPNPPSPPHPRPGLSLLAVVSFLPLISPSEYFEHPSQIDFSKRHFAHVTTLLKTNLQGLFCT